MATIWSRELVPRPVKKPSGEWVGPRSREGDPGAGKRERELLAKIKFLKASVEYMRERDIVDEQLRQHAAEKKKIGEDLPKIKKEIKELSEVVDQQKKARDEDAAFGTYGGDLGVSPKGRRCCRCLHRVLLSLSLSLHTCTHARKFRTLFRTLRFS